MARIALTLALALAAAAATAGCGASDTVDPAAVADAAGATAAAGGAQMSMTGTVRGPGLPRPINYTALGRTDSTGKKVALQMDMSGLARALPNAKPADFQIRMVMDLPVIYMSTPQLAKKIGKPWIKEDIQKVASSAGIDVPGLMQGNNDPRQYVDYLRSVDSGVKRVGTDTIRGVKTTHYKATVDLRKYPDRLPAAQRAQARAGIERLIQLSGTSSYPVDVWIDAQHRVRRIRQSFSQKAASTGQRMTIDQTADLYDFGIKSSIEPPPASQVKDITAIAARQLQRQP